MIIVSGDSHCRALSDAVCSRSAAVKALTRTFKGLRVATFQQAYKFSEQPFFTETETGVELLKEPGNRFLKITGLPPHFQPNSGDVLGFSCGFHRATILRAEYWKDFTILPQVKGKQFFSSQAFYRMVVGQNIHILEFAKCLMRKEIEAFFVMAPPLRRAMIERQAEFVPFEELKAVNDTYLDIMRREFDAIGTPYIEAPSLSHDGGVLKPEFDVDNESDAHHANEAYGILVWEKIAAYLDVELGEQYKKKASAWRI